MCVYIVTLYTRITHAMRAHVQLFKLCSMPGMHVLPLLQGNLSPACVSYLFSTPLHLRAEFWTAGVSLCHFQDAAGY